MSPSGITLEARVPNRFRTKTMRPETSTNWEPKTNDSTVRALKSRVDAEMAATKRMSVSIEVAVTLLGGRCVNHPAVMPRAATEVDAIA